MKNITSVFEYIVNLDPNTKNEIIGNEYVIRAVFKSLSGVEQQLILRLCVQESFFPISSRTQASLVHLFEEASLRSSLEKLLSYGVLLKDETGTAVALHPSFRSTFQVLLFSSDNTTQEVEYVGDSGENEVSLMEFATACWDRLLLFMSTLTAKAI